MQTEIDDALELVMTSGKPLYATLGHLGEREVT